MALTWVAVTGKLSISKNYVEKDLWTTVCNAVPQVAVPPVDFSAPINPQFTTPLVYTTREEMVAAKQQRLAAFQVQVAPYAVGMDWFTAAIWCNAASLYFGLPPVYEIDGQAITGYDPIQYAKGKLNIPTAKLNIPTAKKTVGIRLVNLIEWEKAEKKADIELFDGVQEWLSDNGRTGPFIAEKMVADLTGGVACNMYFDMSHCVFRLMKGE